MTTQNILAGKPVPFCSGCGHSISVNAISKALETVGFSPLDVVIVSDIGCCGLVDPLFATHTIHGLHGRSSSMALGVTLGLSNDEKKVIAIQGDGGVTIGLQHLLEAARRNINMTLVVMNNLLYGMTGGQISGLSTKKFNAIKNYEDDTPPFDICKLAHQAGASYCARVTHPSNYHEILTTAFETKGFSLVEISSLCPSYGVKKMKELEKIVEEATCLTNNRKQMHIEFKNTPSLFESDSYLFKKFEANIDDRLEIIIAGSAGKGVQSAAELLTLAGILSGLHATVKGEYPITIGTGFSMAEVILSRDEINYTGLESPDVMIVVSEDGMKKVKDRIKENTILILDKTLSNVNFSNVTYGDFQKTAGGKGAVLCAIIHWFEQKNLLPKAAFLEAAGNYKHADDFITLINRSNNILCEQAN